MIIRRIQIITDTEIKIVMIVTKSQAAIMTIDTQMKGKINDIIKVVRIIKMTTRETFKGNQPVLTPMTIYRKKARNSYQSK